MLTVAINTGTKVEKLSVVPPRSSLKVEILAKLFRRFEPLVSGPSLPHWQMARMISAKPRVAMAR